MLCLAKHHKTVNFCLKETSWLSFSIIRRRVDNRQEEPRGVGGVEEGELFHFHSRSLISNNWSLCLVGWIYIVL